MTVIPVGRLCRSDLLTISNNLVGAASSVRRRPRPRRPAARRTLDAVNRSLSVAGEQVLGLYPPPVTR